VSFILYDASSIQISQFPYLLRVFSDIGVWTVALARHRGGAARVYSIEAVLETYYYLGANIVLNGLHNVVTYHGVVADRPGLVDVIGYNLTGDLYLNSAAISIAHSAHLKQASNGQARTRPTPSFTLDSLYESGKIPACPTFIKLVSWLFSGLYITAVFRYFELFVCRISKHTSYSHFEAPLGCFRNANLH
jgi:FkbM family methyltransferase